LWSQNSSGVQGGSEVQDYFGGALSSGDFNNDGFNDLAIGVPEEDFGMINAGVVQILYGSSTGLQASGTGGPNDQLWSQDSSNVEDLVEERDEFGSALGSGDFNGDGFADLAIGVPFESVGTVDGAGAVHVLYGASSGLQASGLGAPSDQFWYQGSGSMTDTAEHNDFFGFRL
jgi:hypothetical protein